MYTFKDLVFEPHLHDPNGFQSRFFFPNGYGVSVVRFRMLLGFYSYTDGDQEWELAVVIGKKGDWELTYDTPITNDVIGHLTEDQVTDIMRQVQELPAVTPKDGFVTLPSNY